MAPSDKTSINDANICKQYTPLVDAMVRRLHVPDALRNDARQEGYVGVLAAIRKYDITSPVHFSVFARPYVKGAILRRIYNRTQLTETALEEPAIVDLTTGG